MSYLRYPQLSGDTIVFVADDDVWRVDAEGGRAERLTSDRVPVSRPRLSRDGASFAWASRRDGEPEVYVAPVSGGPATRLTYWNHRRTRVLGWTADGRVVAASPAGQPFPSRAWAYALPVDGGPAERLPYGPISGLARRPGGPTVLQSAVWTEPPVWKRYRGGTASKLWIDTQDTGDTGDTGDTAGAGEFSRFLGGSAGLDGQLADPVWCGERLVFCSDHQGHGNVYSVRADGSDLRRHSDHTGSYARDLSGDLEGGSTRLVYQRAGRIYRLDTVDDADAEPVEVPIELPGTRVARQPAVVAAGKQLRKAESLSVDHTGRASAVEVRGTIRWLTHRDGPVPTLADTPGVRARLPRVRPGAQSSIWVTDADGDDALELTNEDGTTRRLAAGRLGRVLELAVAPAGDTVAVAGHDGRVLVVAPADGAVRELEHSEHGDASGLVFSPDSRWLAWAHAHPAELSSIRLASVADGAVHEVTAERFRDFSPSFTPDGRHLAFLSARTFDPMYDAHTLDLSFPVSVRPYLVPLAADTPSPFDPQTAGREIDGAGTDDGRAEKSDSTPETRVDTDGIADRVVAVPVEAGRLSDLHATAGGLVWCNRPLAGEIGAGRPEGAKPPRPSLWRWDFGKRFATKLVPELDWYQVSGDGKRLVVRDGEKLTVVPSEHAVKPPDGDEPGELVEVDLARMSVRIDPGAQWQQMLVETWRLMRDHFWIEDMGGVDWDDVRARYEPLVDAIATRDDLSELLWEMIGELGSSHAYERQPFDPPPDGRAAAFLGADLRLDADGRWLIDSVLRGESSVPAARAPLTAAGTDVRAGDVLVAINGHRVGVTAFSTPAALLAGLAGKPVELSISRDGSVRQVTVVPTANETPIRYQSWVAENRAAVHAAGDGRIGYVHVPDMMSTGWAEFNRDLRREMQRDALIVDTRDNGGGHVSELVVERLARRPLGAGHARHFADETYPASAPRGPVVSIANEYAGSDGDIVNEAFHELNLGTIVGTRTWGGVIGIDGRYELVDGTSVTQPRFAFWFRDAGWGVENHGVDPDVEVPFPPQAWVSGTDPQLDASVRILTGALAQTTPLTEPELTTRPDRATPPLPPR